MVPYPRLRVGGIACPSSEQGRHVDVDRLYRKSQISPDPQDLGCVIEERPFAWNFRSENVAVGCTQ